MNDTAEITVKVLKRTLADRMNAERAITWIENSPQRFNELIQAFDEVVARHNTLNVLEAIPDSMANTQYIRFWLHDKTIPTITGMMCENKGMLKQFIKTARGANILMMRGESNEGLKERPYLSFHTSKADDEALVIGGIFHMYEELLLNDQGLKGCVQRDVLLDSMIEVLSMDTQNPLYDAVANPNRLDWIRGWKKFSEDFRTANGFSSAINRSKSKS